jgi:signal transduction histidine kinase
LVKDVLDEFGPECAKRNIKVIQSFDHVQRASVDRALIEQVMRNIIRNAIESMESNGELNVSVHAKRGFVVVTVRDTGAGIKEENSSRLFDLGFTTKLGQHGAGVGLALARRIIEEAHNGRISLRNNADGIGAIVTIELPLRRKVQPDAK